MGFYYRLKAILQRIRIGLCIRGSFVFYRKFKDLHFVVAEEGGLKVVADGVDVGAVDALVEGEDGEKGGIGIREAGTDRVVGVLVAVGESLESKGAAGGIEVAYEDVDLVGFQEVDQVGQ